MSLRHRLALAILPLALVTASCDTASEGGTPGAGAVRSSSQATGQAVTSSFSAKSSAGEVMFEAVPKGIEAGVLVFDLRVTTHSGNLADLDLRKTATLRFGDQTIQPVSSPSLRGHHNSVQLSFPVKTIPDSFRLVFHGVRSMDDMTLQWP